jgi:hypothetical protein
MTDSEKIQELVNDLNDLNNLIIFLFKKCYENNSIREQMNEKEKLSFDKILIKNWKKMGNINN